MEHRALAGKSQEIDSLSKFKAAVKKQGSTFDPSSYSGKAAVGWAYNQDGEPVGYMSRWHQSNTGILSPSFEAFKIDYVDEIVRLREEITSEAAIDRIPSSECLEDFDSEEEMKEWYVAFNERRRAAVNGDIRNVRMTIKIRQMDIRKWRQTWG